MVLSNPSIFSIYITPRCIFNHMFWAKNRLVILLQMKTVMRVVVSSSLFFFLLIFTCKWQKTFFSCCVPQMNGHQTCVDAVVWFVTGIAFYVGWNHIHAWPQKASQCKFQARHILVSGVYINPPHAVMDWINSDLAYQSTWSRTDGRLIL